MLLFLFFVINCVREGHQYKNGCFQASTNYFWIFVNKSVCEGLKYKNGCFKQKGGNSRRQIM